MKRISAVCFLLLLIGVVNGQIRQKYFYAVVVGKQPYVFITDPIVEARVTKAIVRNDLIGTANTKQNCLAVEKDKSFIFDHFISRHVDSSNYRYWPLSGPQSSFSNAVGIYPGGNVMLQKVSKDNSGIRLMTTVEDISYNFDGTILLRCASIDNDSLRIQLLEAFPHVDMVAAFHGSNTPSNKFVAGMTSIIEEKVGEFEQEQSAKIPTYLQHSKLEIVFQAFQNAKTGHRSVMSAALAFYPTSNADREGSLIIWDENGEVVFGRENDAFFTIEGITDVNGDLSHELIIRYKLSGIESWEVLSLERKPETNEFMIHSHFRITFPHSQGCGC